MILKHINFFFVSFFVFTNCCPVAQVTQVRLRTAAPPGDLSRLSDDLSQRPVVGNRAAAGAAAGTIQAWQHKRFIKWKITGISGKSEVYQMVYIHKSPVISLYPWFITGWWFT